jgi:hypothetical protein
MENDERVKILCQISRSESLEEAADLAFALLGNPIFITDSARTVLAYTKCVRIDSPFWQETIVNAHIGRNMSERASDFLKVHSDSTHANLPVLVTDHRMPEPRIVKTVVADGRVIASVVLTAYIRPFADEDIYLVELLSSLVSTLLAREHYTISTNEKSVDNFCIKILDGAKYDERTICERFALLGYVGKPFNYVLALNAPEDDGGGRARLSQILESLRQVPYLRCFSYDLNIVCLYSCDHEIVSWSNDAPSLFGLFQRLELNAGTSQCFHPWASSAITSSRLSARLNSAFCSRARNVSTSTTLCPFTTCSISCPTTRQASSATRRSATSPPTTPSTKQTSATCSGSICGP